MHASTGCDVTSKIGKIYSAMKNNLKKFDPSDTAFKSAEHYLVNVTEQNSNCTTLDELIQPKINGFFELPLTSYFLCGGHITLLIFV